MTEIVYVITVTYPPNATDEDFDEHLGELIDCMSSKGLGVEGQKAYFVDPWEE